MKARIAMASAATAALLASMLVGAASPAQAQSGGFQVSGTQLLDANGNPFIIRGISHPHVWYQNETASFAEIADLGANTVRVVLGSGHQWGPNSAQDLANVVTMCKQNELICMLEVHDATGFGEAGAAVSINQVVDDYWTDPADGLLDVLAGEEAYILVNIANEPRGNTDAQAWVNETVSAIQDMRAAGYDHTLVVDAPNWGQDWQFVMRDNAPQIAAADSQDNTLFSIHMYEVFGQASAINGYLDAFAQMNLPLIVGEFGHMHNGQDVDENTIMAEAVTRGIGYIGWSYSGNSGGTEFLDMTNGFNPDSLTDWGQRIFNGPNGIVATAQCATVYECNGGPSEPPAAPAGLSATATSNSVSLSWSAAEGATSYQVQRAAGASGGTFSPVATVTSTSFTNTGLPADSTFRYQVTASNSAGTSPPSDAVTVTTQPGADPGDCEIDYQANDWGGSPGFTANVTVTNTGDSAISGWTVQWDYASGQSVEEPGWNATVTQSGTTVTAVNASWNGTLAPDQSTSFGFNGQAASAGNNPAPTAFTLNGLGCT
jgi:mannan endo-1,4-beta-mannosidase